MKTTKLSTIVNTYADDYISPYLERIEKARPHIFNFNYGVDDVDFKRQFEELFLIHFSDYEIAFETVSMFHIRLLEYCRKYIPFYYNKYVVLKNFSKDDFLNTTLNEQEAITKSMSSEFPKDMLSKNAIEDVSFASTGGLGNATGKSKTTTGSVLDKLEAYDKYVSTFWDEIFSNFEQLFLCIW